MSATRTAPQWKPWPMRRGNNLPQLFRHVDDAGPVDLTGKELRVRITLYDGTFIDKQAGVDPEFVVFDQTDPEQLGFFTFQPSLALTRDLPIQPAARYEFELRHDGLQYCIGEGEIALSAGENADG
jgi:hypothetical protein